VLLFKGLKRDLRRILHTREVRPITLDGQRVEEDTISSVSLFFFAYMIILFFSALCRTRDIPPFGIQLYTCLNPA